MLSSILRLQKLQYKSTQASNLDLILNQSKVSNFIREVQELGSYIAQLDPLLRVKGPWLSEQKHVQKQVRSCRELSKIVENYPRYVAQEEKQKYLAENLALSSNVAYNQLYHISYGTLIQGPGNQSKINVSLANKQLGPVNESWARFMTVDHIFEILLNVCCGTLSPEFTHVTRKTEFDWLYNKFIDNYVVKEEKKKGILEDLCRAEVLEKFLQSKFPSQKRFSLEGLDSLIPGINYFLQRSACNGVKYTQIGMSHRGRLNVLSNVLKKPLGALCAEMEAKHSDLHVGDVKYHQGLSGHRYFDPLDTSIADSASQMQDSGSLLFSDVSKEDVSSHNSSKSNKQYRMELNIAPNPSHLEMVNPVIMGMVRAQLDLIKDLKNRKVMGMLLHGDASFSGLGIVTESLQMSNLKGYSTGGIVHWILNNQIGFTTPPKQARSSVHVSDIGKGLGIPVLHVNADDPEAVVRAGEIASDWRSTFGKDIIIDLVGYRRHGHNELEDPTPTIPITSSLIAGHPTVLEQYSQRLINEKVYTLKDIETIKRQIYQEYEYGFEQASQGAYNQTVSEFLSYNWQGEALKAINKEIHQHPFGQSQEPTGLPLPTLQWVGRRVSNAFDGDQKDKKGSQLHSQITSTDSPDNLQQDDQDTFPLHPKVQQLLQKRQKMVESESSLVDWAMAEQLAFGTLLLRNSALQNDLKSQKVDDDDVRLLTDRQYSSGLNKGAYGIRLSGQDAERGTFNQRHLILYNTKNAEPKILMNSIQVSQDQWQENFDVEDHQEQIQVHNSPLNEAGTLGFEYGYSLGCLGTKLVIFEAQFGDFVNNAQVIIDQFIASGESRWQQQSQLVLLLPHGFEGQGPDHSSARLERFLQLINDDPDQLPGYTKKHKGLISNTFDAITKEYGGQLTRQQATKLLKSLGIVSSNQSDFQRQNWQTQSNTQKDLEVNQDGDEFIDILWEQMQLPINSPINKEAWEQFMIQFIRRKSERDVNMFVMCPSTPAQYFHALRRQINLPYKKPLIIISPKYLLHHRPCTSQLKDFVTATFFRRIIDDDLNGLIPKNSSEDDILQHKSKFIKRVVICMGQIFYQLRLARQNKKINDVALVRLEQLAPFPHDILARFLMQYKSAEYVWMQEEPKNMGAYQYVIQRLQTALLNQNITDKKIQYIGRPSSATTATASVAIHKKQQNDIIEQALTIKAN